MKRISIKQKMLLELIEYFQKENGYSPTVREMATILEQSSTAVFEKLMALEQRGYIKTTPGKARSIVILRKVKEPSADD